MICLSTTVRNDTLQEGREQRVSMKCRKQLRVEELEMVSTSDQSNIRLVESLVVLCLVSGDVEICHRVLCSLRTFVWSRSCSRAVGRTSSCTVRTWCLETLR